MPDTSLQFRPKPEGLPLVQLRRVLVTGASRGVGADVAVKLARSGFAITLGYREKRKRATSVLETIAGMGGNCHLVEGDLSLDDRLDSLIAQFVAQAPYDAIVLNASGGLEPGKTLPYALAVNCFAQMALVSALLPSCRDGLVIVYVTSHGAHFYPENPVLPLYDKIAYSKKCGERSLRRLVSLAASRRPRLRIVSGDVIEGTTTAMLLDRAVPGFVTGRKRQVGRLPTTSEFGDMIVDAVTEDRHDVEVSARYCGSTMPYQIQG